MSQHNALQQTNVMVYVHSIAYPADIALQHMQLHMLAANLLAHCNVNQPHGCADDSMLPSLPLQYIT